VPKVRAILHARIKYDESLIQCVDPDGHARYEVRLGRAGSGGAGTGEVQSLGRKA
jgi:hypothetical protein